MFGDRIRLKSDAYLESSHLLLGESESQRISAARKYGGKEGSRNGSENQKNFTVHG